MRLESLIYQCIIEEKKAEQSCQRAENKMNSIAKEVVDIFNRSRRGCYAITNAGITWNTTGKAIKIDFEINGLRHRSSREDVKEGWFSDDFTESKFLTETLEAKLSFTRAIISISINPDLYAK